MAKSIRKGFPRRKKNGGVTYVRQTLVTGRPRKRRGFMPNTYRCECGDKVFRHGGGVFNGAAWPQLIAHACSTLGRHLPDRKEQGMDDLFEETAKSLCTS
jgi:hypothetical protein